MKYEELSSKYVEEKKKNQEIVELLEKEQTLNDELIAEMKKVSENTTTISNNYMKLFKDYSELLPLKKNGIVVEWDNDESTRKFIPVLGSLDEIEYGRKPSKVFYTFIPSDLQHWFAKIGFIMKENSEKLKALKEYGEIDHDVGA
jgi:hypothetical protein